MKQVNHVPSINLTKAKLDIYHSPTMLELVDEAERSYKSYEQQAAEAGISAATLRNWKNGRVHRPRIDTLEKFAASKGGRIGYIPGKGSYS